MGLFWHILNSEEELKVKAVYLKPSFISVDWRELILNYASSEFLELSMCDGNSSTFVLSFEKGREL